MLLTRVLAGAVAASCFAICANASSLAPITLDWNNTLPGGAAGTETVGEVGIDLDMFSAFGVTLSTTAANGLSLYNSNCGPDFPGVECTGGDPDLASGPTFGTKPQGRLLIAQDAPATDNGDGTEPDDLGGTYTITLMFVKPVLIGSVDIMDLDETPSNITFDALFADGSGPITLTTTHEVLNTLSPSDGENQLFRFLFDPKEANFVTSLSVSFSSTSGSLSGVFYTPIPVPPALPMAAAGIALLAGLSRYRRARD